MKPLRKRSYKTVPGESYGTPKEIWGFRSPRTRGKPEEIARAFLEANAGVFKFSRDLEGLEHQRTIRSLGANHVIGQQVHLGRRVHRAYVTVHIGNDRRVFLVKNRATPPAMLPAKAEFEISERRAIDRARRSLGKKGKRSRLQDFEEMWFSKNGRLRPAYRVRLSRRQPQEEWIIYVNAKTGGVLGRHNNLTKQRGRRGRALVFDPSPVTALGDHERLLTRIGNPRKPPPETYKEVTLHGLAASGYLDGVRVTTRPTLHRVRRRSGTFFIESTKPGFEEVMVYYHLDAAIRYLERLGYKGSRAIFDEPVRINVNGTLEDNSWYSPWERLLTFGLGEVDDAEDGETIIHEFGHALQDAICPDFGQTAEAAAMGEGFGDYLAASLFANKKPERYRTSVMSWDGLLMGLEAGHDPPCLRQLHWDWTYKDFNKKDDEHENGEIWSATLWDILEELGRDVADRIVIESHFQLDGFTDFARGARAIVDADVNLFRGRHGRVLRRIFKERGIGPV
jgi:hypothetical protein